MAITNIPVEELERYLQEWLQEEIQGIKRIIKETEGGKGDNRTTA